MIRTIAVAALMGGLMAIPVATPTQAATMGANCLILPLLQADCRDAIHDMMSGHQAAMAAPAMTKVAAKTADAAASAVHTMLWWEKKCSPAAAGAGHLFDCN